MKYLHLPLGLECNTTLHKLIVGEKIKMHRKSCKLIVLERFNFHWLTFSGTWLTLILWGKWLLSAKPCTKQGPDPAIVTGMIHTGVTCPVRGKLNAWGRRSGARAGKKQSCSEDVQRCVLLPSDRNSPAVQLCFVDPLCDFPCLLLSAWLFSRPIFVFAS